MQRIGGDAGDRFTGLAVAMKRGPRVRRVPRGAVCVQPVVPVLRDDDWCGEWSAIKRKADTPMADARNLMAQPSAPSPIRTAGLAGGSLMAPVAPLAEGATALNGRFGSD